VKDLKKAVNKEYLNGKFLKKDENGNYFDLKGAVIKNSESYYDGLFENNDLFSKAYVDTENSKRDLAIANKTNKSYVDNADTAPQTNIDGTKEARREVSVKLDQGLDKKLSIHGGNSMTVDLDMDNNKIKNMAAATMMHSIINSSQLKQMRMKRFCLMD